MTMRGFALAAIAASVAIGGCSEQKNDGGVTAPSTPIAAVAAPAGKKWTEMVSATPEGGMRMGNPDAPIKLIEYASYTCPHCAHFAAEGGPKLRALVDTGKLSWEFRSFLLHAPDPAVTLLANCRGAETFFPLTDQVFATQDDWLNKIVAMPPEQQQALQSAPTIQQFRVMMEASGLYGFMAARGLPRAKAEQCLSNQAAIDALTAHQNRAQTEDEINGTPSFLINGQKQEDVAAWEQLEPRLKAAGA